MGHLLKLRHPGFGALAIGVTLCVGAGPALGADAKLGRSIFQAQCGSCHTAGRGGGVLVGPNLFGVVGRTAGTAKGFRYSRALSSADFTWTDARLRKYLRAPAKYLPGNRMPFHGLTKPAQLDDLVAYLDTLK